MERPVVVVGSLNVDLVVSAERFPSPGETLRGRSFTVVTGGKGANQAAAAARLGYPTQMVGRIGQDGFAAGIRQDLDAAGVECVAIAAVPGATGSASVTTVDGGENTIVLVSGANAAMDAEAIEAAWPVISGAGMVLAQLEIPLATVIHLAGRLKAAGVPLMLDPAPACELPVELLRDLQWITPNETEARMLCGEDLIEAEEGALRRAAEATLDRGVAGVVLKLGARGVYLASGSVRQLVPSFRVEAADTTAAGDCFNGAFAVALLRGEKPVAAARFAVAAAALSTTRHGALPSMPNEAETRALMQTGG